MTLLARLPPVLLVALMLHTAVLPQLRVLGVAPDLLLLLGIATGIVAGPGRAALVGFVAGLLADSFLQTPFGLSALCYSLVGHLVGVLQAGILHAGLWVPTAIAVVASAGGVVLFGVLGAVLGEEQLLDGRLLVVGAVVAVLNGLLLPLVARPVRWALCAEAPTGIVRR